MIGKNRSGPGPARKEDCFMDEFRRHRKIDAHTHIGSFGSPFNINFDTGRLLEQMDTYQIEKTILCSSDCHGNEETAAAFRRYPDRIIPLMWINCSEGTPAYDELEHYLRDEQFAGAKLQTLFDGYTADAPCIDPAAEICEQYGKPMFIHSGHPPFSLPWQIGLLAERHPRLSIVMIHMGHAHGVYVDAAIAMARKYGNIWLETSGTSMSCQIRNAYETVGHERVMFGIDSPFHHPTVEIQKILASGVDEKGLENIFFNNAAKFMKL